MSALAGAEFRGWAAPAIYSNRSATSYSPGRVAGDDVAMNATAPPADPRTSTRLARALLFAIAYFAGSELGYSLSLGPAVGGTFWPPAGIALAVFLFAPTPDWPLLLGAGLAANFASDLLHGQMLPASIGFAAANLSEPVLGALLMRRILGRDISFEHLAELAALALVVVFVSAPMAALIGALTAEAWTNNPPGLAQGWQTWWVGDAVGALVLTAPVFRLLVHGRQLIRRVAARWVELTAFMAVLVGVTQIVFLPASTTLAMPFLVFPVLLWASLRFGLHGVGGALMLVVWLATTETAAGRGPFAGPSLSPGDRLIALQIFVGVMAISFQSLALIWEERTRVVAALRVAHSGLEVRYRRIVEQSPFPIASFDAPGHIREANAAWRHLWGEASDIEPDRPADHARWTVPGLLPLLTQAFAGDVVEMPDVWITPPGSTDDDRRCVRGVAYPITVAAGRVSEVIVIQRDITEIVEFAERREHLLEAERYARVEAERASRLKDEFLATLSHELRTPLNAIVGWAHLLRNRASDETALQGIETIERSARAQAKLIEDLLDMARITTGKVGLSVAPTRLADVVSTAAEGLRPAAEAKGLTLAVDVSRASSISVLGDAGRLEQVVGNLLGNGIKFTPAPGRVDVQLASDDQEATLTVRDTGEGIPPEFLPSVFDRFRQADGSVARRHGGLGLGLSIARHIVEMHAGSIAAASDGPGRGATFTVRLPVIRGEAAARPGWRADPPAASLAGMRVLVVDDERDALEIMRRLLAEQGCEVTTAGTAEEALARLAERPFDVLLSDIGMPGVDGYELLRLIRARPGPHPRAIAVTAFARAEDRERALAAGFDGHLEKPLTPARLLRSLAALRALS